MLRLMNYFQSVFPTEETCWNETLQRTDQIELVRRTLVLKVQTVIPLWNKIHKNRVTCGSDNVTIIQRVQGNIFEILPIDYGFIIPWEVSAAACAPIVVFLKKYCVKVCAQFSCTQTKIHNNTITHL